MTEKAGPDRVHPISPGGGGGAKAPRQRKILITLEPVQVSS